MVDSTEHPKRKSTVYFNIKYIIKKIKKEIRKKVYCWLLAFSALLILTCVPSFVWSIDILAFPFATTLIIPRSSLILLSVSSSHPLAHPSLSYVLLSVFAVSGSVFSVR